MIDKELDPEIESRIAQYEMAYRLQTSVPDATDEFGYNVVEDGVHVHDFNATILHLMGIDHERLTHKYQGCRFRLTDVHGQVLDSIIAYATTIASMLLWRRIFDRVTPRETFNLRLPLVSRTGCTCGDTSWG